MIALDTSAILTILLREPEEDPFQRLIAGTRTLVGAPTRVESRLVLESRFPEAAEGVRRGFLAKRGLTVVAFDAAMFEAALDAFV
ncbi:type II toxin-antitoxin system VapC family toxin [uncultured Methylobacterium sp.]|uniref:type II toxin-antitoxin system VapC family toxin n=1 Tax=uncultured Methylobacterium sp. TaxID=157278 RepID=UPI0035CB5F60